MLTIVEIEDLYSHLNLSELSRNLINEIRSSEPVRRVRSSFRNMAGFYSSQKMGWTIQFESRTVELPAIELFYEYEDNVLEYWDQAYKLTLKVKSSSGKNCTIAHVPDFFIIRYNSVGFEEWKPEEKLEKLANQYPDRYIQDRDTQWHNSYAEEYTNKLGIYYQLRTNSEIDWIKYRNIKYLRGYFQKEYLVREEIATNLITVVTANPGITFSQLISEVKAANSDDINALIASKNLYIDLSAAPLIESEKIHIFCNQQTAKVYSIAVDSSTQTVADSLQNFDIKTGSNIIWDNKAFTITTTGETQIYLRGEDGLISLSYAEFDKLIHLGQIKTIPQNETENSVNKAVSAIFRRASPNALEEASRRYQILRPYISGESPQEETTPERTIRFWKAKYQKAKEIYGCGLVGLIDNKKGNSTPRYSNKAREFIDQIIEKHYETLKQKNVWSVYEALKVAWSQAQKSGEIIENCPCHQTFYQRVRERAGYKQTKSRQGSRAANQNLPPCWQLEIGTPRHGDRPFEIVHIDHTLLDIEIICPRTGKNLGRPWVTAMIDAYSRRILAVYITFDAPSYRSCMMVLRICGQRFGRFSETIIVDNGKEFKSIYFDTLLARFEATKMHRPPDMPRFSSIIERWFGSNNTQFINNLRGNTQLTKHVRLVKKENNPKNLAVWTLDEFYDYFANEYCYGVYDQREHPALEGFSPLQAFAAGLLQSGSRPHQRIKYDDQFIILTLPSTLKGTAKVQPVSGIRINYLDYWSVETSYFRQTDVEGKQVPVRYDPFDWATAYAYVGGIWVRCVANNYAKHQGYSERQVMMASAILKQKRKLYGHSTRNDASEILEILLSAEKYEELWLQRQRDLAAIDVRNLIENRSVTQLSTSLNTSISPPEKAINHQITDSNSEIDSDDERDEIKPYSHEEFWS